MVHIKDNIVVLHERRSENHDVCNLRLNRDSAVNSACSELLRVARIHHVERRRDLEPGVAKHQEEAGVASEVTGGEHREVNLDACLVVKNVVHHGLVHDSWQDELAV